MTIAIILASTGVLVAVLALALAPAIPPPPLIRRVACAAVRFAPPSPASAAPPLPL